MMIVSLALGALVGEAINLGTPHPDIWAFLREKSGNSGDNKFVDAFVTASLTVCIGAMAIVGSIQDGLTGDISVLVTKAILDCIIIFVMTASMGKGCIFSAIPVFLLQGIVTLLAAAIAPFITQAALDNISPGGGWAILCVGHQHHVPSEDWRMNLRPPSSSLLSGRICPFKKIETPPVFA